MVTHRESFESADDRQFADYFIDKNGSPVNRDENEQLNIHVVVRPDPNCPDCKGSGGVQTGFEEYSTCPCVQGAGLRCTGA